MQAGAAIRVQNQALAGNNSPATKGLAIVENAQKGELSGAMPLSGDPSKDLGILDQLQTGFAGGIKQNRDNQNAVYFPSLLPFSYAGPQYKQYRIVPRNSYIFTVLYCVKLFLYCYRKIQKFYNKFCSINPISLN